MEYNENQLNLFPNIMYELCHVCDYIKTIRITLFDGSNKLICGDVECQGTIRPYHDCKKVNQGMLPKLEKINQID